MRRCLPRVLAVALSACTYANAASAAEWRNRTIYQLLTDRFAPSAGSPDCTNLQTYCGGTFLGIIQHLDYIQSMGFDAIWYALLGL
jgi:alpha-amylase